MFTTLAQFLDVGFTNRAPVFDVIFIDVELWDINGGFQNWCQKSVTINKYMKYGFSYSEIYYIGVI